MRAAAVAASLSIAARAAPAHAADGASGGDKAMAEALFRAGKELQASGHVAEACVKYVESHRIDPKPGTILNVAACHEEEGRTATAWADYAEAAAVAARAKQTEREKFARGKVEELEKKLSWATFQFPKTPDVEVLLDGKALTTAASGTRVPLDPGAHVVEARAAGKMPWSTTVDVPEGPSERTVTVPALADDAAPRASTAAPTPIADDDTGSTMRTAGWVALGVGVTGAAVGTIFGVRTLSEKSTVDEHCRGAFCDATGLDANDSARSAATVSTVAFVVSGVAIAAGVVLFVAAPRGTSRTVAEALRCASAAGCVW